MSLTAEDVKPVITVYSTEDCRQCMATYRKLDELGITYDVEDARDEENTALISSLKHKQAPVVIVTVGTDVLEHWSGYRPDLIPKYKPKEETDDSEAQAV